MASRATCNWFVRIEFRQLWIAAVISMLGEWFNTIALFFLILEYTGSEFLLGMLFTVRMAGFAILQPFIGLLRRPIQQKDVAGSQICCRRVLLCASCW